MIESYNSDAEQAVLQCMCERVEYIHDFGQHLPAEAFHNQGHRVLYLTMLAMAKEESPVDLTTVTSRLIKNGRFDSLGGAGWITGILNSIGASGALYTHYRDILGETYLHREAISIMEGAKAGFTEGSVRDWIAEISQKLMDLSQFGEVSVHRKMPELVQDALTRYQEAMENKGKLRGVKTGFRWLDFYMGGLQEGHLWIVGGSYSDGKSSYVGQIMLNAAKEGAQTALYGLEMPADENVDRFFAQDTQISSDDFNRGTFTGEGFAKLSRSAKTLSALPMHVRDVAGIKISSLISDMRFLNRSKKVRVFAVDYGQLINADTKGHSREREIAQITSELKGAANRMKATIILPMQLNEDGKLRESRAPGGDADKVLKIRVPRMDEKDEDSDFDDTKRVVLLEKNRGGQRYRKLGYDFCGSTFSFLNEQDLSNINTITK